MVSALDRKLLRDLGQVRGQVLTICLVVATGITGFIAMQGAYQTLQQTRADYYREYRFPEVFASARRAPNRVIDELRTLPGVSLVATRVVEPVLLPGGNGNRPASGQIVTISDHERQPLNRIHLTRGRLPDPVRSDEAVLLEHYAETHDIHVGDHIPVVINGTLQNLHITGLGMSPEFVLVVGGDMLSSTPGSHAVLWMRYSSIAPAFDMDGAFNDIAITLQPGASTGAVLSAVDRVLDPYGGFPAFARNKHTSDHFIESELAGLQAQVTIIPLIFLSVAAFLLNTVLGRIVELQRPQVATLKAVGYSNASIGLHFLKLVSVIVLLGAALGITLGAALGDPLLSLYRPYFRFPDLKAELQPITVVISIAISFLAAAVGAFVSVRKIVALAPAEAMRPAAPPNYRGGGAATWTEYLVGPAGQMVLREVTRRPGRVIASVIGISLAVAIMIIGRFASDSIGHLLDLQYGRVMQEDITVALSDPIPAADIDTFAAMPGVRHVEAINELPVRISYGSRSRDVAVQGWPEERRLRRLLNRDGAAMMMPSRGVVLSDILAERLMVSVGDTVDIEMMRGDRRTVQVAVSGVVRDMIGMQGYMRSADMFVFTDGIETITTLLLDVRPGAIAAVEDRLRDIPSVAGVSSPAEARTNFEEQQGGMMLGMSLVLAFFASIIAIGIVYNNARIVLSTRRRDLASMRVLGFRRSEISTVLLGELALQVVCALPLGMWLGKQATSALLATDPENFRMPAVISLQTYVFAALVTVIAAAISGFLVRRKLDSLDLIAVLKTRS